MERLGAGHAPLCMVHTPFFKFGDWEGLSAEWDELYYWQHERSLARLKQWMSRITANSEQSDFRMIAVEGTRLIERAKAEGFFWDAGQLARIIPLLLIKRDTGAAASMMPIFMRTKKAHPSSEAQFWTATASDSE